MTRGIRNNNPANIRRGSSWRGLSAVQRDKEFCQFDSIEYGIRAFFVLMRTYHYFHKCNSVGQILHRFAPLCENNTYAYISFVTKFLNQNQVALFSGVRRLSEVFYRENFEYHFSENTLVNTWFNKQTPSPFLRAFAKAVFKMESNFEATDEQIDVAISLL